MKKPICKSVIMVMTLGLCTIGNGQTALSAQQGAENPEDIRLSIAPAVAERGGVLLQQGQLEISPQLRYSLQTTNRLYVYGLAVLPGVIIGSFDVADVERNIVEPSLTFRYGLWNQLQMDVMVPWRYSNDIISYQSGEETKTTDTAFGDIEAGLSYQFLNEKASRPALVGSVRVKTRTGKDPFDLNDDEIPTGSGFWGIHGTLSAIKTMDPVVVFSNIGYTYNISRTIDLGPDVNVGDVEYDPGDSIDWGLGFAYALSPDFSLNMQYSHQVIFRSSVEDIQFPDNNAGIKTGTISGSHQNIPSLKFGTVLALDKGGYLDFSIAIGLSEDAPDVTVQLAVPFRFDLF